MFTIELHKMTQSEWSSSRLRYSDVLKECSAIDNISVYRVWQSTNVIAIVVMSFKGRI